MYEKLNKYRIRERLVRGFVVASGIPALVAVVVLITLMVVARIYSNSLKDYGFAQGDVGKAMTHFAEARSTLRGCIGYDDEDAIESMRVSHEQSVEDFTTNFADLEQFMVSAANKQVYSDISSKLPAYWALDNEIIELGATTDRALCEQAQDRAMTELMPLYDEINDQLISIMDIKVERGNSISGTMTIVSTTLVIVIAVVIFIAITSSIKLGKYIAGNISAPLIQLDERLAEFAKGDLTSPFPEMQAEDEVADIINSANDMAQTLNFIIYDMEYILGEMSNSIMQSNQRTAPNIRVSSARFMIP